MIYKLQLMDTQSGVGCFAAMPGPNLSFSEMLDHLRRAPFDDFMHEFTLQNLGKQRPKKVEKMIKQYAADGGKSEPVTTALLYEACLVHERLVKYLPLFDGVDPKELSKHTPAIHIRSSLLEDQPLHRQWTRVFRNNIFMHEPLKSPEELGLTQLEFSKKSGRETVTAQKVRSELAEKLPAPKARKPLEETTSHALKVLEKADAFLGPTMAHKASLSPIARLRHWRFSRRTKTGRNSFTLEGIQTSYGRGLIEERANASYSMEMAERFSSYAGIGNTVSGLKDSKTVKYARFSEMDVPALDPSSIRLEVPYEDQPLHWLEGETLDEKGKLTPLWIPLQFVYLFNNCDEQSLFSAFGSTGLASGNTIAEAKVSALLEAVERDCDATMPFDPSRCFRVTTSDPEINKLLFEYMTCGIHVWFMDMTPEFGIPCYKSVVVGPRGDVNKGSGSDLNARSALISAMTETPYPFPGPPSAPVPEEIPARKLEDLPDLSTGSAEGDLIVLEKTLTSNGYTPCYAELTRKDLDIPVVRALIPGLEVISDFDQYSRVSPRLYANYLRLLK